MSIQDSANIIKAGAVVDAISAMAGFSFSHGKNETIQKIVNLFNEFFSSLTESEKNEYFALCDSVLKDRVDKNLPPKVSRPDASSLKKAISELSQELNFES